VSVNVAARQLFEWQFCETVEECVRSRGLPHSCLELELTEGTLVQDFRRSNSVLGTLRRLGIRVALDDFGTGALAALLEPATARQASGRTA
jgi:EAL domain-containing protein (putative c-di-GMP-specific phosphodiesterase class I)